jgi:phage tail tape-measure protein
MIQAMRLLIVTGISVGMVACHSNPNSSTANTTDTSVVVAKVVPQADTAGLAAFKAAKQARYEDSLKNVGVQRERERRAKASYAASSSRRASYTASGSRTSSSASGYGTAAYPTAKKKSHAARNGALIGAGAGAITGALVTKKNKGVGALIGGVAGAAGGYGVGKIVENKKKNQDQ